MAAELSPHLLSEKHRPTLDQALDAIRTRAYWSPHPEHPKAYGEGGAPGSLSAAEGKAAFDAVLHTRLDLGQPGTDGWTGGEISPYGPELGVEYPHADLDVLLPHDAYGHGRLACGGPRDQGPGLSGDPRADQRQDP